jgi:hypothetical protein
MKINSFLIAALVLFLVLSCKRNQGDSSGDNNEKEIVAAVNRYALDSLENGKILEGVNGIYSVSGEQLKYSFSTKEIVFGEIDEDNLSDAIIPVKVFRGHYPIRIDHLILLRTENGFVAAKVMENIFKVKLISDRIITAEYTEQTVDSPIYGCRECIVITKYQLKDKDLVILEQRSI